MATKKNGFLGIASGFKNIDTKPRNDNCLCPQICMKKTVELC